MSVFEWITEHEGFFSGLVAIAALVGIAGATTRLLWVRARDLGPSVGKRWLGWAIAAGGLVTIIAITFVILNPRQGDSESQETLRTSVVSNAERAPLSTNNVAEIVDFGARPAIAVLPFDNLSADPEQAYFADGLAEDLIARLSTWRAFPVIARNSSFQYRGGNLNLKRVSAELGTRYLVEGSVRRAGNRIRITAQLIDATSGEHVWAKTYDREVADVFALQDEISATIAASPTMVSATWSRSGVSSPGS